MSILVLQLICISTIFAVIMLCGLVPVFVVHYRKTANISVSVSQYLSFSNCFAAGVFIGMCFLGLIPIVRDKFNEMKKLELIQTDYPLPELIVVLGFFAIMFVEQSVRQIEQKPTVSRKDDVRMNHIVRIETGKQSDDEDIHVKLLPSDSCESEEISHAERSGLNHSHCHADVASLVENTSSLQFFILLLALSVHSLFEGMALGLQTEETKILHLFVAVLLHESLVAFAMGVNTAKLNVGTGKSCCYVFLFTCTIPVGIILGLLIGQTPGTAGLIASGILQGVAAGVFIHVTFLELIPEEFITGRKRMTKVLLLLTGFLFMAVLNFVLDGH